MLPEIKSTLVSRCLIAPDVGRQVHILVIFNVCERSIRAVRDPENRLVGAILVVKAPPLVGHRVFPARQWAMLLEHWD